MELPHVLRSLQCPPNSCRNLVIPVESGGIRECHGFTNPCGLVLRVTAGAGTGCEFATLTQPVPATWV